jgi:RNA polymerase sigma-70 factor (sigma-E family)
MAMVEPGQSVGPEPFEEFYRRARRPMIRLAYLMTAGSSVAEELVQEAFIGVHRHWAEVEHPDAYLRRSVVHQVLSHHRRIAREARLPAMAGEPADPGGEPVVDELRAAVARLGDRQRTAVVLRYYGDLSEGDIANAMGCGVAAVKALLFRALKELREVVER